jgi:predicted site-specific integrase-resolvase
LKVAIYARVSTDDKGQDPLNQLLELREFAARPAGLDGRAGIHGRGNR